MCFPGYISFSGTRVALSGALAKDNADVSPGIHYRLPAPFEEVTLVKADNIQKFETGVQEFRLATPIWSM